MSTPTERHAGPVVPPLTAAQLDPLGSPLLQHELPGLATACDEQAIRAHLQSALCDSERGQYQVKGCELDQATLVAGEGCTVRYLLDVEDTASGQTSRRLVSGRIFPSLSACSAYLRQALTPLLKGLRDRPELAPFATLAALIAQLNMVVYAFPVDAELESLGAATDPMHMLGLLSLVLPSVLARTFTPEACSVEVVDYARQHRCTLRYTLTGTTAQGEPHRQVVYGKLTADGSGALADPMIAALSEHVATSGGYQFNIPRSFGWQPTLHLSLLEAIPGESPIASALKQRLRGAAPAAEALSLEAMIEACAKIAAALHTSGIALGPRRSLDDELAKQRAALDEVQRVSPELGARLGQWLDQVEGYARLSEPLDLGFSHGDFTHPQILFDGATAGLVDFDSICQAEPALDLAQFLTYLRIASLKARKTSPAQTDELTAQLGGHFVAAYLAAAGQPGDGTLLRKRIQIYRCVSLIRRTIRSWQKMKVGRIESAVALLEEEMVWLHALNA